MTEARGYVCPCCGYAGLDAPAYQNLGEPPFLKDATPPYCVFFGDPSYDVCDCCGFEFGNDDDPGTTRPESFEEYRSRWLMKGTDWFNPSKRPDAWSLSAQLVAAGLGTNSR